MKRLLVLGMAVFVFGVVSNAQAKVPSPYSPDGLANPNSSRVTSPSRVGSGDVASPTFTVVGKVDSLDATTGSLTIKVEEGWGYKFDIDKKVRFVADRGVPVANANHLALADLKPGQSVKITLTVDDRRVREVKLRRDNP